MTPPRHFRRAKGAALMAVLILIAILGIACISALRVIAFDMELTSAKVHGSRARQVAEMGIALGTHPQVKRSDPILKQMNQETGEGFEVKVTSEGGRFNLNYILSKDDKPLLRDLFTDWGLELEEAQEIADALGDWIDADDDAALNGAEKDYYEGEGRINQPFNRPFYDISEISLVRGMNLVEAVRPDWRNFFCVWSGGPLDVNDAAPELIAAAAEVSIDLVGVIPERVNGVDGIRDTTDDAPFNQGEVSDALALLGVDTEGRPDIAQRFTANDQTTRIESTGYAEGAKRKITVIVANRTGRPALLERTEEIIP